MSKHLHRLTCISSLLLGLCALYACSSDDLIEEETILLASDPESIELVFTITMDHSYTATRAATRATRANSADNDTTWKDTQNRVDAETAEDAIQSMQVILFTQQTDESNSTYYTFLTTVAQQELTSTTDTENSTTTFTYTGVIPTGTILTGEAFSARIVILANCSIDVSDLNGNTKYTDTEIGEAIYTMTKSNSKIDISSTGIPMWGTTTGSWIFTKGEKTDIGSLALLRAMAKIKVSLDSEMISDGYRIVTASLQGFSDNQGYIHPTGYGTVDKTEDLTVGDSTFHARTSTSTSDSLTFFTHTDSSYAYIYVPEYDTPSSNAASINVHIYRYGDDGKDYCNKEVLYLKEYTDGATSDEAEVIDLVRNHILSYTLSRTVTTTAYVTTNDYEWYYTASDISWDAEEDNLYVLFVAHDEYYHTDSLTSNTLSTNWVLSSTNWSYADTVYWDRSSEATSSPTYVAYYNLTGTTCQNYINNSKITISQNDYGDADAVWCLVTYPRWKDDDHDAIRNGVSTAHYLFYVTPLSTTGRRTWKAYLTNTDAFTFAQGAADWKYTRYKTNYANATQYYASTGVARDYPYMIAVEPNPTYYWTTLQIGYMKKYHPNVVMKDKNGENRGDTTYYDYSWTTTGDSIYDTANFSTSSWSDTWYESYDWTQIVTSTCTMTTRTIDSNGDTITTEEEVDTLLAVYTDLFILLDGTTATTALPINRSSDNNGQFVNWFAGGTHEHTVTITDDEGVSSTITLDQEQWMRIWRTNAVTTSGENDYANILTNINKASDLNERWYNK